MTYSSCLHVHQVKLHANSIWLRDNSVKEMLHQDAFSNRFGKSRQQKRKACHMFNPLRSIKTLRDKQLIRRARVMFEQGERAAVVKLIGSLAAKTSPRPDAVTLVVRALRQMQDHTAASRYLAPALIAWPNHTGLLFQQASLLLEMGDAQAALDLCHTKEAALSKHAGYSRLLAACENGAKLQAVLGTTSLMAEINDLENSGKWPKVADILWPIWQTKHPFDIPTLYSKLATGLRHAFRFKDAHEVIRGGLETLADTHELEVALGELLMAERKWARAAKQWRKAIELAPNNPVPGLYIRLADAYLNGGESALAKSTIEEGLGQHPGQVSLLKKQVYVAFNSKAWAQALEQAETLPPEFKGEPAIQTLMAEARFELASPTAEQAYDLIGTGQPDEAKAKFAEALDTSGLNASKAEWTEAFSALCNLSAPHTDAEPLRQYSPALQKIMVAGTGWSGSGALYDFFREFEAVEPVHGEFRHIEHSEGLHGIKRKRPLVPHATAFFAKIASGLATYDNKSGYIPVQSARWCALKDQPTYAAATATFLRAYGAFVHHDRKDPSSLHAATNALIDAVIGAIMGRKPEHEKTFLLDNVIHCQNVALSEYLENFHYFAVFRDPRAQFAANMAENPNFHGDVQRFIKSYRDYRLKFERQRGTTSLRGGEITVVQFEEFVLSEDYRMALAGLLNIGPHLLKHKYFDPDVSGRNVRLHDAYADKAALRQIEEALPEFLWEEKQ